MYIHMYRFDCISPSPHLGLTICPDERAPRPWKDYAGYDAWAEAGLQYVGIVVSVVSIFGWWGPGTCFIFHILGNIFNPN